MAFCFLPSSHYFPFDAYLKLSECALVSLLSFPVEGSRFGNHKLNTDCLTLSSSGSTAVLVQRMKRSSHPLPRARGFGKPDILSGNILAGSMSIVTRRELNKILYHTAHHQESQARISIYSLSVCLADKIFLQDQLLCYFTNINLCIYSLRPRSWSDPQGG